MPSPKPTKAKIKKLLLSVDREGMKELVEYLEKETDYFTAPASTRFHEARKGGWMEMKMSTDDARKTIYRLNNPTKTFLQEIREWGK